VDPIARPDASGLASFGVADNASDPHRAALAAALNGAPVSARDCWWRQSSNADESGARGSSRTLDFAPVCG